MGSLTSHRICVGKGWDTGPTVYRPYQRRLESLTVCDTCLQRQHFLLRHLNKDPECWSNRSLNQQPPARQINAYLTELTGRNYQHSADSTLTVCGPEELLN